MVDSLSDDVAMEVFVRLPVRSIMRFRCVSKAWNGLISELGRRHRSRLPPAMVGYIQQYFHQRHATTFAGIGRRSCYSDDALAAAGAGAGAGGPDFGFVVALPPSSYAREERRIVSVCNGLALCYCGYTVRVPEEPCESCYVVCNPATKRWKRLPETSHCPVAVGLDRRRRYRVLGYRIDTYVRGAGVYIYIYRFKMFVSETGSWVDCPGGHRNFIINPWTTKAAFYADGIFYVLATFDAAHHLLAVGLEEAACRRIVLPPAARPRWHDEVRPSLGSLDGVVRLVAATEDGEILVWALEAAAAGTQGRDRWVPKHAVDLLGGGVGRGRERLAEIGADPELLSAVRFVEFHPDVDAIFLGSRGTVLSYHFGTGTLEVMSSDAVDAPYFFFPYSPSYSEDLDL